MKFTCIILIYILFLLHQIKADLPVNCKRSEISGMWRFELTPGNMGNLIQNNCGHNFPDDEQSSAEALQKEFVIDKSLTFECMISNQGTIQYSNRDFLYTMVYNEGIHFDISEKNFFLFFYYKLSERKSVCSKTAVGWYFDKNTKLRGCVRGETIDGKERVNKMENKTIVLENVIKVEGNSLLNQFKRKKLFFRFSDSSSNLKVINSKDIPNIPNMIDNLDEYVKFLNSRSEVTWKVKNYNQFHNMSFEDLNRFVGRSKGKDLNYYYEEQSKPFDFEQIHRFMEKQPNNEYVSWENCLTEPKSQGKCGSCFAISTLSMVEARLRLKRKKCDLILSKPNSKMKTEIQKKKSENSKGNYLSLDYILDCSFYNQGCDGGYPFLVGKFGYDHYIPFESEFKKISTKYGDFDGYKNKCDLEKTKKTLKKVKIRDYKYLTGKYEITDEDKIKKEIKSNGPVVLSFSPRKDFSFYFSGVYGNCENDLKADQNKGNSSNIEWTKVDHSVLAFGYGSDEEGTYWLLQNSWGDWGDDGNLKMVRGCNFQGIESMVEIADPQENSDF